MAPEGQIYRLHTCARPCADVCVERKTPQEGSEMLLLSRPSLWFFLPLIVVPAAHPVSMRNVNNPPAFTGAFVSTFSHKSIIKLNGNCPDRL